MDNQGLHFQRILICAGMLILFVWAGVLAIAFIFRFLLGFYVPEILTSVNFSASGAGYAHLLTNVIIPIKRADRFWRSRLILSLIMGVALIINGVYGIIYAEQDIFIYLCLLIGSVTIIYNTKNVMKA